jgi:hypothetical protein
MFQSCKYKIYLGEKDGAHSWEHELTDSEFGTVFVKVVAGKYGSNRLVDTVTLIIQEYGKRNLNVAANLVLAFVWLNKQYPNWSIKEMINDSKKKNPLLTPYEEDLQKYLPPL